MDDHCFIFLKDEYPEWCQQCEKMEKRIMEGDGISAITICGKIAEQISKEICIKKSLDDLCSETQYDRNNELKRQGILTEDELKLYNQIRKKRNYGIHDDEKIKNEMADAYHNHENLYKISTNFYRDYIDSDYDFPKYKQPKSVFSQDTIIEQHTNSHNSHVENSNNTVNITNINHNHNYSQKEMKAEKKEVHINLSKKDEKTKIKGINKLIKSFEEKIRTMECEADYLFVIVYGYKITESMVKLYLEKEGYSEDYKKPNALIYARDKGIFPPEVSKFLMTMVRYRNEGVHGAKPDYKLTKIYLETFNLFLLWFNEFYSTRYHIENPFRTFYLSSIISSLPPSKEEVNIDKEKVFSNEITIDSPKEKYCAYKRYGILTKEKTIDEITKAKKLKNESQKLQKRINKLNKEYAKLENERLRLDNETEQINKKISALRTHSSQLPLNDFKNSIEKANKLQEKKIKEKSLTQEIEKLNKNIYKSNFNARKKSGVGIIKTEAQNKKLLEKEEQLHDLKIEITQLEKTVKEEQIELACFPDYEKIKLETDNLISMKDKLDSETKKIDEEKKEIIDDARKLEKRINSLKNKNMVKSHELIYPVLNKKPLIDHYPKNHFNFNDDSNLRNLNRRPPINSEIQNIQHINQKDLKYLTRLITHQVEEAFEEKYNRLLQEIRENTRITEETREISRNIEKKLDELIKNMRNIMDTLQSFSSRQLENASSEEEIENILKSFTDEYIRTITEYWEEKSSNDEYNKERRKLEISLGENAWNKMAEKSQNFLITSKVMYNDFLMINDMVDYSGICILVSKALEEEIFRRFFTDFIEYLSEKYGNDYSKYHTALTYNRINTLYENQFTMGNIAYVFCYKESKYDTDAEKKKNEKVLMDYCEERIFLNKNKNEIKKLLNEYAKNIEKIREDFRNPSAHRNKIQRINAEECFNLVLDIEKLLKRMLDSFNE